LGRAAGANATARARIAQQCWLDHFPSLRVGPGQRRDQVFPVLIEPRLDDLGADRMAAPGMSMAIKSDKIQIVKNLHHDIHAPNPAHFGSSTQLHVDWICVTAAWYRSFSR